MESSIYSRSKRFLDGMYFKEITKAGKSFSGNVVGREKLLIALAVSRTRSLLITQGHKHKSNTLTS